MNKNYYTENEDNKIRELILLGKHSYEMIGEILGRPHQGCRHRANKLGLKSTYLTKKYELNEYFWSIPNLINSYWAGFSSADSSIKKISEKNYRYNLILSSKDINHLEQLKKDCGYTGPIKSYERHTKFPNQNIKTYYSSALGISSAKWGHDLEDNFNIIPNKVYRLQPPDKLNHYLLLAWLAGYIDGDGTIFADKDGSRIWIEFASASEHIIKWIREFVNITFNEKITNKIDRYFKKPNSNCFHFHVAGIRAAIVIDYLSQFNLPTLDRKWKNPVLLEYIDKKKKEYSHMFKTLNPAEIQHLLPENNKAIPK